MPCLSSLNSDEVLAPSQLAERAVWPLGEKGILDPCADVKVRISEVARVEGGS